MMLEMHDLIDRTGSELEKLSPEDATVPILQRLANALNHLKILGFEELDLARRALCRRWQNEMQNDRCYL